MKVYYDASLFGRGGAKRRHAGQPLALEARFDWGGGHFYVPAIYLCAQGVVLDLLERLDRTRIEAFYEKWRWARCALNRRRRFAGRSRFRKHKKRRS